MIAMQGFFTSDFDHQDIQNLWQQLCEQYHPSEEHLVSELELLLPPPSDEAETAARWLRAARDDRSNTSNLFQQLDLSSDEGLALLSMTEALVRIPDTHSSHALLEERLGIENWEEVLNSEERSLLATTIWRTAQSSQLVASNIEPTQVYQTLKRRIGSHALLDALHVVIRTFRDSFIFSESPSTALDKASNYGDQYQFAIDLLNETAVCAKDAQDNLAKQHDALNALIEKRRQGDTQCGLALKLSTLHAKFEGIQSRRVFAELTVDLIALISRAREYDIPITIDAEEIARQELTLLLFKELLRTGVASGWDRLGITIQAYSKRALPVLGWLEMLGRELEIEIPITLTKGRYWESEVRAAQQHGLSDYPVFTLKPATDINYLVCARFLLSAQCRYLKPEFASHNALTIAQLAQLAAGQPLRLSRTHGVAIPLYQQILSDLPNATCTLHAPVGDYHQLLPYLTRQLLRDSAYTQFLFQTCHQHAPLSPILRHPLERLSQTSAKRATSIPLPQNLYQPYRLEANGLCFGSTLAVQALQQGVNQYLSQQWLVAPIINGERHTISFPIDLHTPQDIHQQIGILYPSYENDVREAYSLLETGINGWRQTDPDTRIEILARALKLVEAARDELVALLILEAGRSVKDAFDEFRSALNYGYSYLESARNQLRVTALPAITRERNHHQYEGRGIFLCLSPFSSPMESFLGQISAALVSGNVVFAKTSRFTPIIGMRICELWLEAGIPRDALCYLPGVSDWIEAPLLNDYRLAGIAYTGSAEKISQIYTTLANRKAAPMPTVISHTGGIGVMIADSTTQPEFLVEDIISSAFRRSGQTSDALSVVYLQEEIADEVIDKLCGAVDQLKVGPTTQISTEIGPIISRTRLDDLHSELEGYTTHGRILYEKKLNEAELGDGYFFPPTIVQIYNLDELQGESFGPMLHLVRFPRERLEHVVGEINRYGLVTALGIHSRNRKTIELISRQGRISNVYINRDMRSVATAQPSGGAGYAGSGPKAGGEHYLRAFCVEKVVSTDIDLPPLHHN